MKIPVFLILFFSIFACVACVHGKVVRIQAKFNESDKEWRSWIFQDCAGESSVLEISKDFGETAFRITYKISRSISSASEFILEQNVEFRNGRKVSKFVWSKSKITNNTNKFLFVKSVEMVKDGSIKFNSELVSMKFHLMTDSGEPLSFPVTR